MDIRQKIGGRPIVIGVLVICIVSGYLVLQHYNEINRPITKEELVVDNSAIESVVQVTFDQDSNSTKDHTIIIDRALTSFVVPSNWSQPILAESDFTKEQYDFYVTQYGPIVNDAGVPIPYEKVQQEMTYVDTSFDSRINMTFEARKIGPDNYLLFQEVSYPDTRFYDIRASRDYWEKAQGELLGGFKWVCDHYVPPGTYSIEDRCTSYQGNYEYTARMVTGFYEEDNVIKPQSGMTKEELKQFDTMYPDMVTARNEMRQILSSVTFN